MHLATFSGSTLGLDGQMSPFPAHGRLSRETAHHDSHSKLCFGRFGGHMAILIASMYCVFTYIWLIFMVNVGKYTIYIYMHGCYGISISRIFKGCMVHNCNRFQLHSTDKKKRINQLIDLCVRVTHCRIWSYFVARKTSSFLDWDVLSKCETFRTNL